MPFAEPNDTPVLRDWLRQSLRLTARHNRALFVLLVVVTVALGWILLPFYGTVLWAIIIAMLFAPVNRRLFQRVHGRRNLAALLTLAIAFVVVVLPLVIVSVMLTHEMTVLYKQIQIGETKPLVFFKEVFNGLPSWVITMLHSIGLDVSGALLWAALMAFLSLLPAVGAALVWFPVAAYFVFIGEHWQGIALMAYGALVIGSIDNLLRPILVGRNTGLPDYLVLITTLGGVAVFGVNGFVLGPVIAAMFISAWHIYLNPPNLEAGTSSTNSDPSQKSTRCHDPL